MDHRSVVIETAEPSADLVGVDQAIFTSVPSPTGRGYRIIASSPGVGPDEKREITRHAPAHGSLCTSGPDATALLAYPLAGGRYCVALSLCAGREHTARGGQRVYTHFALLDRPAWLRFGCNPAYVYAALDQALDGRSILHPPPTLGPLLLTTPPATKNRPATLASRTPDGPTCDGPPTGPLRRSEQILLLSLAMLQDEHLLAAGADRPLDLLNETIISLPLAVRRNLAVSTGLKYSPSRRLHLCFVTPDQGETQRTIRGQETLWVDMQTAPPRLPSPFDPWLGLLRRWLESGRHGDLWKMTTAMNEAASSEALARVASICAAIDQVENASPQRLAELNARCARTVASSHVEAELLQQFFRAARRAIERPNRRPGPPPGASRRRQTGLPALPCH